RWRAGHIPRKCHRAGLALTVGGAHHHRELAHRRRPAGDQPGRADHRLADGRPAAEKETMLLDTGPAGMICRLMLLPAAVLWAPGSSSGMAAGFIWSRSVLPGASIPLTVPTLEYCQNA